METMVRFQSGDSFMFLQNRFFLSIDLSFQDQFNFDSTVSNLKSPLLIPNPYEEQKCKQKKAEPFSTVGTLMRSTILNQATIK